MLRREGQDSFLGHGAVNVVVLQYDILLQHLDCIDFIRSPQLSEHDLPEGPLPENFDEMKIVQAVLPRRRTLAHQTLQILV